MALNTCISKLDYITFNLEVGKELYWVVSHSIECRLHRPCSLDMQIN